MISRFLVCVGAGAVFVITGCSDNTGPREPTAQALIQHLDSLYNTPQYDYVQNVIADAATDPAWGGTPTPVTVTTDSGTSAWQALMYVKTVPKHDFFVWDTLYVLVAYSDYAFSKVIDINVEVFPGDSRAQFITLVNGNSVTTVDIVPPTQDTATASLVASVTPTGGACSLLAGVTAVDNTGVASCAFATMKGAFTLSAPELSGALAQFQHVNIASQQFNGVQLVEQ